MTHAIEVISKHGLVIQPKDIAWLGGLLEGEGWFSLTRKTGPFIGLKMTDRDTVIRAAKLFGGRVSGPFMSSGNRKPTWSCHAYAKHAAGWMMTIYQFLGQRRRTKVRQILGDWRAII